VHEAAGQCRRFPGHDRHEPFAYAGGGGAVAIDRPAEEEGIEDVPDARGVACITYNNDCAIELETRLARLGIVPGDRAFIGTVHSFALSQVIGPYARCVPVGLPADFKVASKSQTRAAVGAAYSKSINGSDNPHDR